YVQCCNIRSLNTDSAIVGDNLPTFYFGSNDNLKLNFPFFISHISRPSRKNQLFQLRIHLEGFERTVSSYVECNTSGFISAKANNHNIIRKRSKYLPVKCDATCFIGDRRYRFADVQIPVIITNSLMPRELKV